MVKKQQKADATDAAGVVGERVKSLIAEASRIGDNRSTIKVGAMDKLPKVIDMVIEAVSAGELDKVLKAALAERRVKLRQVS